MSMSQVCLHRCATPNNIGCNFYTKDGARPTYSDALIIDKQPHFCFGFEHAGRMFCSNWRVVLPEFQCLVPPWLPHRWKALVDLALIHPCYPIAVQEDAWTSAFEFVKANSLK